MQTAYQKKEGRRYKYDVIFLFVVILAYMLCVVPLAGGLPQYMRYIILPLFIFAAFLKDELHLKLDLPTIALFLLAVTPSIAFSPYLGNALLKAITVLLMFIACSVYFSSREETGLLALYKALVVIGYVAVIANMFRYLTGGGFSDRYFRGYFGNRNAAGPVFVITFVLLLAEIFKKQGKKKVLPSIFLAADVIMLIETQSRGAFMGMLIGLILFLFFIYKKKDKFFMTLFVIFILVTLFWGKISQWDVVRRILDDGVKRDSLWEEAGRVIKENFFFGVGFSSSAFSNQSTGNENMNFHNSYISMMADVGLFGVLFLFVMFAFLFAKIYKNYKKLSQEHRLYYVALLSIVFAYFGLSFGESYLIVAGSPFSFTFWCIMFCLSTYSPKSKNKIVQGDKQWKRNNAWPY